jgi:hypothetical protein
VPRLADEDYVRPPIVAVEPPSPRTARIRFNILMVLVMLALAFGVVALVRTFTGGAVGDPQGVRPPVVAGLAAR